MPARLTPADGRKFGLTVGIAFLALAGILGFWRHKEMAGAIVGGIGALLVVASLAAPTHLGPVRRAWMGLAHAIAKVTSPVAMGLVFFLIIAPIGLLMRFFGRRPLVHRVRDGSFWAAPSSGGRSDLERQF